MWWALSGCGWITGGDVERYFDADGDGARSIDFGGRDCDDADVTFISLTAFEDLDGDGWGTEQVIEVCALGDGAADQTGDCDDTDPDLTPRSEWFTDGDGDGYGAGVALVTCVRPEGAVPAGGDCADDDPRRHPGVGDDEPRDGVDGDCDGTDLDGDGDGLPDFAEPCNQTDVVEVEPFTYADALAAAQDCTVLVLAPGEYPAGEVPGVGRVAILAAPGAEVLLQGGSSDRAVLRLADGVQELVVEGVRGEGGGAFVEDRYGASLAVSQVETATSRLVDLSSTVPSVELYGYVGTGLDTLILASLVYDWSTPQAAYTGTDYYLPPPILERFRWRGGAVRASVSTTALVYVDAQSIALTDVDLEASGALDTVAALQGRGRVELHDVRFQGNIGRYILRVVGDDVQVDDVELLDNLALEDDPGLVSIAGSTVEVVGFYATGNEQGIVEQPVPALVAFVGEEVSVRRLEVVDNAGAAAQVAVAATAAGLPIELDDVAISGPGGIALVLEGKARITHATLSSDVAIFGTGGVGSASILSGEVVEFPPYEWTDVLRVGAAPPPDCTRCAQGNAPFVRAADGLPTDLHLTCESGAPDCAGRPVFEFDRTDCAVPPCPVGAYGGQWPYADTDDDGLYDYWERQFFGNLSRTRDGDADGDGVINHLELHELGTLPDDPDTDGDLVDDGDDSTPLVAD
jgi:hypothetical protein